MTTLALFTLLAGLLAGGSSERPQIAVALASGGLAIIDDQGHVIRRFGHPRGAIDSDPAWSPDGRSIVFTRTTDNYRSFHLFIMRSNGTRLRRLTSGRYDWRPDWSRDGRWIAYQSTEGIRIIRADGTGSRLVVRGEGAWPAWTAAGHLSFAWHPEVPADQPPACAKAGSGCGWVMTVHRDGSHRRLLVRGRDARWSPDGKRIVYTLPDGGVAVATASGRNARMLSRGHEADWAGGDRLVYSRAIGRSEIWMMTAAGHREHRIFTAAGTPAWRP